MFNSDAILTSYSVMVIVRSQHQFLLVQENWHGRPWNAPMGKVEAGEQFTTTARQAVLTKAGIPIEFEGVLRIEYSSKNYGTARQRIIFLARPTDDRPLKGQPDKHSLKAVWVTPAELANFPLRISEVGEIFQYVANNGPVYPLSLITMEGESWPAALPA